VRSDRADQSQTDNRLRKPKDGYFQALLLLLRIIEMKGSLSIKTRTKSFTTAKSFSHSNEIGELASMIEVAESFRSILAG
jgi:hypothetical protein